jgi:lycopene cyclase domain-containing protein
MNYPVLAGIGLALALLVDLVALRTRLVTRAAFWTTYAILLAFQLLVNGVLTGTEVVRYNSHDILGQRIAYAPVEDIAFGFSLILLTLSSWVALNRRGRAG